MKYVLFSISLVLFLIFSSGCEKKIFDARKKYVGTWEMTITSNSTHYTTDMGGNTVVTENTSTSLKDVEITIDEANENGLILHFPNHQPKKVLLSKDNRFEKDCQSFSAVISGQFQSKKELSMTMSDYGVSCSSYSAGGYSNQIVTGVKK